MGKATSAEAALLLRHSHVELSSQAPDRSSWPSGGGEMGARIRGYDWNATPLGPIEDWPQSLKTAVGIMLTTRHPVFILWGPELICLYNDAYAASLGPEKHPFTLGTPAPIAWPEAYPIVEPELKQVMAGGEATWQEDYLVPIHRYGRMEEVYWTYSYGPIHNASAPNGVGGVLALIKETTHSVMAQRRSEERLRLAVAAGQLGEWELDLETDTSVRAIRHDQIFGYDQPLDEWGFEAFISHVLPEDRQQVEEKFRAAAATGSAWHLECRIQRANDGTIRWIEARGQPQRAADGRITKIYGIVGDITERKQVEEHQQILINELNHRVKNTLATVHSIATQTLRSTETAGEARGAIEGRLLALSRAHDVLTRENWEGASLKEVVAEAIAPYSHVHDNRLHAAGPDVHLVPRMALALAMALQELATNAVKYGALSNATGEVRIEWTLMRESYEPRLRLMWVERGGPPVEPPTRQGFGTRLLERSLASELNGNVSIEFLPTGLVCTVDAPLPSDQIVSW
ncbi:sensor histidine kinase [Microvirga arabica]|uniref:Blue-light-activated histidine kinase n=1 Tax=Microvirga arabica TaxID=1128671 RepID=A0ABV6Y5M5_9HYPH